MHITLTPIRHDTPLTASVAGDVLTLNGEAFDFAAIPEGATLPRAAVTCDWLGSDIERSDGEIRLTLLLPHGANAPAATRFPAAITLSDGPLPLPVHDIITQEETLP